MSDYGDSPAPEPSPAPESAPESAPKKGGLTQKQREDLKKHMDKLKKEGMPPAEVKSHRMKMMARMRRGDSVSKAHKDITKSK